MRDASNEVKVEESNVKERKGEHDGEIEVKIRGQ